MAINYTIQAGIININDDTPKENDVFLVDTNVWYWMTYTRASLSSNPPWPYQSQDYPTYTNAALGVGAKLYRSGISFAELTHRIERSEYEIFAKANPGIFRNPLKFDKNYRHSRPTERSKVIVEIKSAWGQVMSLADPLDITIDEATTNAALVRAQTDKVDGYDFFILESMKNNSVVQIITDDGDFSTIPGIQVLTANRNVIATAERQGKLLKR